ncbi:MAG TPA: TadE/TadG family type IV pilus assembly protein [Gemmataceae bacterium]|nr:TadE/TadG family type IV pilus assembly protein [Gemmataceae bacterium]
MALLVVNSSERASGKVRPRHARRGAHAVEFAFVGILMFVFVLGLVEVGRALMVQHLLINAARQGCRVGVIAGKSNSDITTTATNALTAQGVSGETATVQVNDGSTDAVNAKTGDEITVIVSVPASRITWVPGVRFLTGNISGQYTLRRE